MMTDKQIREMTAAMTLEEKASLCSGSDMWHLKGVERLGIPSVMVSDGPHGLRTQRDEGDHLGINGSIPAVCFPAACALAASFDRELLKSVGETLGEECLAEGVSILLGPAINIKRSPLCGRNFEYFSEDPYLSGELAAGYIAGVQSKNIGVSVKHFAANNQETDRMVVSADVDERALREIYLPGFERAVQAGAYTVMCSYNKLNGVHAAENGYLLTDILRGEWGFDGFVMSDWGAVTDRVKALAAGLELEMPGNGGDTDALIARAVESGVLDEKTLDTAVERILRVVFRCAAGDSAGSIDLERDHARATDAERESIVLLKNEGALPLGDEKIVFIGDFAVNPRYQGGGSSHINAFKTVGAAEAAAGTANVTVISGSGPDGIAEAVSAAAAADKAVVFAGLPDSFESEGYDRSHMRLPDSQNALIEAVAAVQPNTVVVLHNGSPVEMPWIDRVNGAVEAYLGGQGVGQAVFDVLTGRVNPSGRLPETFPLKLSDNPSYIGFPGAGKRCRYGEGIYVGYRYYDKKEMPVLFPFGHGLSYTTFEYADLTVTKAGDYVEACATVLNAGNRAGKEVVQLYVGGGNAADHSPIRQLKGFEKLDLKPGESKRVRFKLDKRAFSYYDEACACWRAAGGRYEISVGASSRDIRLTGAIDLPADPKKFTVTMDTTLGELLENERTRFFVEDRLKSLSQKSGAGSILGIQGGRETLVKLVSGVPLRGIIGMMKISTKRMEEIIVNLNAALDK